MRSTLTLGCGNTLYRYWAGYRLDWIGLDWIEEEIEIENDVHHPAARLMPDPCQGFYLTQTPAGMGMDWGPRAWQGFF